ncbi:putative signal transducing protein [Psychroflexus salis]|nr:DUF2007 domain-containing protein [Psychroflexus salis]
MDESNYEKIYAGGETDSLAVKDALHQNDIKFIEKNNIESGLRAGFYGGTKGVEIYVTEENASKAKEIINQIFDNQ